MSVAKNVLRFVGTIALLALVSVILTTQNTGVVAGQPISSSGDFLRVQGIQIVDVNDKVTLLRGANYPGYDECDFHGVSPNLHSEATYSRFASLGFNVVRLPITWAMLEPKQGVFDFSYVSNYIDKDVQWARQHGLYIVLDMHQYYWAKKFNGCGFPNWAVDKYSSSKSGMIQFVSNFWMNDSLQSEVANAWGKVAHIYANDSTVAGYDVLNEPFVYTSVIPYLNATNVDRFYSKVITSIRSVDSNHLIFVEPANMLSSVSFGENIVWSPHFYLLAFNSTYSSQVAKPLLEQDIAAKYKLFVVQSRNPMWIGEFSAFMKDDTYQAYLQDAQSIFEKYQLGWAWWGFNSEFGQKVPTILTSPPLTAPVSPTSLQSNETSSVSYPSRPSPLSP
jgi:endoglycosylceramidase